MGDHKAEQDVGETSAGARLLENDGYDDAAAARGMMSGCTQTSTTEEPRVTGDMPVRLPGWRGHHVPYSLTSPVSRYLLAALFFLTSCLSVILGVECPFWIVPAVVLVFTLGSGHPGGGPIQVAVHRTCGKGGLEVLGSLMSSPTAHFNHMIQLSFDIKDLPLGTHAPLNSSDSLCLLFQVQSIDWFGRHRLEGYGQVTVPCVRAGASSCPAIDVTVQTWRPNGGIRAQFQHYFTGSSSRLGEESFAAIPSGTTSALNKFGMVTESSGYLRFRCNMVVTDPRVADKLSAERGGESGGAAGGRAGQSQREIRRTVEDILHTYKTGMGLGGTAASSLLFGGLTGGSASFSATGTAGAGAGAVMSTTRSSRDGLDTSRSSVPRLTGLSSTMSVSGSKADKVAEVLARAREKAALIKQSSARSGASNDDKTEDIPKSGTSLAPLSRSKNSALVSSSSPSGPSSSKVTATLGRDSDPKSARSLAPSEGKNQMTGGADEQVPLLALDQISDAKDQLHMSAPSSARAVTMSARHSAAAGGSDSKPSSARRGGGGGGGEEGGGRGGGDDRAIRTAASQPTSRPPRGPGAATSISSGNNNNNNSNNNSQPGTARSATGRHRYGGGPDDKDQGAAGPPSESAPLLQTD